jgi:hypothetical protein
MEALVYIFLLIGTLIFLCRILQKHLRLLKIKPFYWFYFF